MSPPVPTTEGRQPHRRVLALEVDDAVLGEIRVPLIPLIGRIEDLITIYGWPTPRPLPVVAPVYDTNDITGITRGPSQLIRVVAEEEGAGRQGAAQQQRLAGPQILEDWQWVIEQLRQGVSMASIKAHY